MRFFAVGFGIGILAILAGWFFLNVMGEPAGFRMAVFNETDEPIRVLSQIIARGGEVSDGDEQSVPPRQRRVLWGFERAQRGSYSQFRLQITGGGQRASVRFGRDRLAELDDFSVSLVVESSGASFRSNAWVAGLQTGRLEARVD